MSTTLALATGARTRDLVGARIGRSAALLNPTPAQQPVAVIGRGRLASGIAERLLDHDFEVRVWNRSPTRARRLAVLGARVTSTPAEAASGAGALLLCASGSEDLRAALHGPGGVLAEDTVHGVLVCMSAVSPQEVKALALMTDAVVDVGVLGTANQARAGRLQLYTGGRWKEVREIARILDPLAHRVKHVGPLGAGTLVKLLSSVWHEVGVQLIAELSALGGAAGLSQSVVAEALRETDVGEPVLASEAVWQDHKRVRTASAVSPLAAAVAEADRSDLPLPLVRRASQTAAPSAGS
ncbi:hypothetical protein GCM10010174_48610 [Kutzneria viridogrisea]|uniref:6-phosphogluconate dehydrogenase NADP-binding domain-containing protein n=2 Tax=Kutzneria TaxID=43356 RepID=W5W898_9PSEU|nr:NAD(P)-binding domain-containing protein [Kutzneria albida]AHH96980.1 hypothetical protein KALB_3616 [Kutzneria albida DSM 43870]MBA8932055.1 3-hydroxyisobutyrate dehydrogenase [Kutzneria viridogrisea]